MRHFLSLTNFGAWLTILVIFHGTSATAEVIAKNCGPSLISVNFSVGKHHTHPRIGSWSRLIVVKGLRTLYFKGFKDLSASFLTKSKDSHAREVLSEALGFETTLKTLYIKALEFFDKDLNSALREAKLPTNSISNVAQNWPPAIAIKGLQALAKNGYYPSRSFLTQSKDPKALEILIEAVGFKTTLSTLYNQTLKLNNGDFIGALRVADVYDPNPAPQKFDTPKTEKRTQIGRWTPSLVHKAMRALYENGYLPTYKWLSHSRDPGATVILIETVGFKTSLSSLFKNALKLHEDNFRKVLADSGLSILIDYHANHEWTPEDVRLGLQALYKRGFKPNPTFLQTSKDLEAQQILSDTLGFQTTLNTLYDNARRLYRGNFFLALHDAGLPADEITYRVGIDLLALVPVQYEMTKTDYGLKLLPYIGEAPSTPVDNIQNQEVLEIVINSLPEDLQSLGEEVIDVILYSNLREPDAANILEQIHKEGNQDAVLEKVQRILLLMAEDNEFREYLSR